MKRDSDFDGVDKEVDIDLIIDIFDRLTSDQQADLLAKLQERVLTPAELSY